VALATITAAMEADRARSIAERWHADDREQTGTPVIEHIRRVAMRTDPDARAVAWLHEALERTALREEELLMAGLDADELRALRLLRRTAAAHSDAVYLAHVELIAQAAGRSGELARVVKLADLRDRRVHPRRRDGWTPPYAEAVRRLAAGPYPEPPLTSFMVNCELTRPIPGSSASSFM
jgi:hypothetical protein